MMLPREEDALDQEIRQASPRYAELEYPEPLDFAGIVVVRGQRMPVGNEKVALVLMLQLHPVLQDTVIVTEVQTPGWTHAG